MWKDEPKKIAWASAIVNYKRLTVNSPLNLVWNSEDVSTNLYDEDRSNHERTFWVQSEFQ
jgi:hypothetical protein